MTKFKKQLGAFFIITCIVILAYGFQVYDILNYPSQIDIIKGESEVIDIIFPFTVNIQEDDNSDEILTNTRYEDVKDVKVNVKNSYEFNTIKNGKATIEFKLLGLIPIKAVTVNVHDDLYLIPGGNTIGVKLKTRGVLVVALSDNIVGIDGKRYSPAIDAGIKVGDIIIDINGEKVKDADHVIDILKKIKNEKIKITIERNNIEFTTNVKPVKSNQDNTYRLGLWVRDKTAGIGTLTFYHPETKKFGALGHGITDIDTGALMPVDNGEIVKAKISSIEIGKKGEPGELRGVFFKNEDGLGIIEKNSNYGIYGKLDKKFIDLKDKKPIPIGLQNEVKKGKATILTTLDSENAESYDIEIIKTERQGSPEPKSMVIKIVDERLLNKTGGIVQGMSGSPIIQDGKIIGAVTHVFVNDPTKGYGLYINWMLKQAGIELYNTSSLANAN